MARISSGTLPVYLEFVCNTGVLKEDADRGLARTHEQTLEGMIMLSGWQSPNKENRAAKEGMKHSPLTVVRNFWPGSETSPRGPLLLAIIKQQQRSLEASSKDTSKARPLRAPPRVRVSELGIDLDDRGWGAIIVSRVDPGGHGASAGVEPRDVLVGIGDDAAPHTAVAACDMITAASSRRGTNLTFVRMWDGGRAVPYTVGFNSGSSSRALGSVHHDSASSQDCEPSPRDRSVSWKASARGQEDEEEQGKDGKRRFHQDSSLQSMSHIHASPASTRTTWHAADRRQEQESRSPSSSLSLSRAHPSGQGGGVGNAFRGGQELGRGDAGAMIENRNIATTAQLRITDPSFALWRLQREAAVVAVQKMVRGWVARRLARCLYGGVGFLLEERWADLGTDESHHESFARGSRTGGTLVVSYVPSGGPADGILAVGDAVVEVDGMPLQGHGARVQRVVRGRPFTEMSLKIMRGRATLLAHIKRRPAGSHVLGLASVGVGIVAAVMGDAVVVSSVHPGSPAALCQRISPGDVLRWPGRKSGMPLTPEELNERMVGPIGTLCCM